MGGIIVKNDETGYKKLEEILTSYGGWERCFIGERPKALVTLFFLLEQNIIELIEEEYINNPTLIYDEQVQEIYTTLRNQARWKDGVTERKGIRLCALNVLEHLGTPTYDQFVYYPSRETAMHCGNLSPHQLLYSLNDNPKMKEICIFPYPYASEDNIQKYYRFVFLEKAKKVAQLYQEDVKTEMYNLLSKRENVIPTVKDDEDEKS